MKLLIIQSDVVGLTGFTSHVNIIKKAEHLKALSPNVRIIVGGHHAMVRPTDFNDARVLEKFKTMHLDY